MSSNSAYSGRSPEEAQVISRISIFPVGEPSSVHGGESTKLSQKVPSRSDVFPMAFESSTQNLKTALTIERREADSCFSGFLDSTFHCIGHFVADYPKQILTVILIFSAICSIKIPFTEQRDDIKTGYTPNGARSIYEAQLYEDFYKFGLNNTSNFAAENVQHDPISLVIFLTAIDGGSMLRDAYLNESVWLLDHVGNNFYLAGQSFYQFCRDFCQLNEPIRQFRNGMLVSKNLYHSEDTGEGSDYRIDLTFPFITILGRKLDMSPHFFGVQTVQNGSSDKSRTPTNIDYLKMIVLQFRSEPPENTTRDDILKLERAVAKYLHKDYNGTLIRPLLLSVTVVADEIVRTGMTLFPYITVGFVIVSVFSIVTVWITAFFFDQWTSHKISMALSACCCPLLATSSALGLLFWFGFRFGTILAVTPFLVMAIGVDDAYLMIHSYQRVCVDRLKRKQQSVPGLSDCLRDRIAEVLVDVGPSITITSLTNVLAFVIGIFSPTPEIQLFCAGNATAIFLDYIYQLFLFTPTIVIAASYEMHNERERFCNHATLENPIRHKLKKMVHAFMAEYSRWLANGFTAFSVFIILVVYWVVSIRSAMKIRPNITPDKLFLADSFFNEINTLRDQYILPNYTVLAVFVNNAGNLSDPERNSRVRDLIGEFEQLSNNMGKEFTHFWLRDYDKYTKSVEEDMELDRSLAFRKSEMKSFLEWPEYRHWNGFMRFDDNQLKMFFATLAFHGSELVNWNKRGEMLNLWREIVDRYADIEAWVWLDEAQFLDQIETLIPATLQSSVATLLCMMIVCFIFMPNLFTVAIATFCIISIVSGVFGFLSLWKIDLDPISMATTLMSIGFSVDFPAHITYHYHRFGQISNHEMLPEERIYRSLIAIGFPLLQCGFSTILFVLCLLFIDTYMSEVFVKTMVLVVSLGLLHGLFVVPTMLCALSNLYRLFIKLTKTKSKWVEHIRASIRQKDRIWSSVKRRKQIEAEKNISKVFIRSAST